MRDLRRRRMTRFDRWMKGRELVLGLQRRLLFCLVIMTPANPFLYHFLLNTKRYFLYIAGYHFWCFSLRRSVCLDTVTVWWLLSLRWEIYTITVLTLGSKYHLLFYSTCPDRYRAACLSCLATQFQCVHLRLQPLFFHGIFLFTSQLFRYHSPT